MRIRWTNLISSIYLVEWYAFKALQSQTLQFAKYQSLKNFENVFHDYKMCNYTTGQKQLILGSKKYNSLDTTSVVNYVASYIRNSRVTIQRKINAIRY